MRCLVILIRRRSSRDPMNEMFDDTEDEDDGPRAFSC